MKTIVVLVDEASLAGVDRLAQAAGRRKGGRRTAKRSEVVCRAVREFLARQVRHEREERDQQILRTRRDQIERQAAVLLAEQAQL